METTNKPITTKDRLASKYADMKIKKMVIQHEKMVSDFFGTIPPTDREKAVYNVYEVMKGMIAKYPILIEDLNDAYEYIFKDSVANEIKINKSIITKHETREAIDQVRKEWKLKEKLFEKIE